MTGEEFIFLSKHASGQAEALPQPVTDTEKKYVYGILGIAKLFGCSLPTANRIKKSGEVYFTDSMVTLAKQSGLTAVDFVGTRYDMGNKLGIMKANCEVALTHPEIGADFKAYLQELVRTF